MAKNSLTGLSPLESQLARRYMGASPNPLGGHGFIDSAGLGGSTRIAAGPHLNSPMPKPRAPILRPREFGATHLRTLMQPKSSL